MTLTLGHSGAERSNSLRFPGDTRISQRSNCNFVIFVLQGDIRISIFELLKRIFLTDKTDPLNFLKACPGLERDKLLV